MGVLCVLPTTIVFKTCRSSFFIFLRGPWCHPTLFGVMSSRTCCSHLDLSLLLGHFPFSFIFNTFGILTSFSLNLNAPNLRE
jgi:hypothetical protein